MTQPLGYLWRMLVFLAGVAVAAALLGEPLLRAFQQNPVLNGVILAVLAGGIGWNIRQVLLLRREVAWLEAFRNARQGAPAQPAPRLLAALASMLASRRSDQLNLSAAGLRSVLDGIEARLDETRELSRYMTGLLIFLGLLGTFWGLLLTIGSVAEVIGAMSLGAGEVAELFDQLKAGLAEPLRGMGVAFSSSLLGLGGALVLGFLDLTAGQAQSRFATELEDWLAGQTRLSALAAGGEGEGAALPPYVQALLEQAADNLDAIQRLIAEREAAQALTAEALGALGAQVAALTAQLAATEARVAERPAALVSLDARSLEALAALERHMARLGQEVTQGRLQSTSELRAEIKLLAQQLAPRPAAEHAAPPRPAPPRPRPPTPGPRADG
ncbi:MAG: flagellar motor protein MotA [Rubritepida sp.]|jgi:hypothetical protein|nr:flagellar motor protein MotA [Rubritepida sp.]